MGTPDEPFLIIYCLALTKHIYKKIKSKYLNIHIKKTPIKKYLKRYLNKPDLGTHNNTHKEYTN